MVLTANWNQQWKHRHRKNVAAPFASTRSRASRWYLFCAYSLGRIMHTSINCASVSRHSDSNYVNNNNAYVPIIAINIWSLCLFTLVFRSCYIRWTIGAVSASVPHYISVVPMVILQNNFHGAKRRATKCIDRWFVVTNSDMFYRFINLLTHCIYLFYYSLDYQKKYLKSSIEIL